MALFQKGQTAWNEGTVGLMKANSGSFQKGRIALNKKEPIQKRCPTCSAIFSVRPGLIRIIFCSRPCIRRKPMSKRLRSLISLSNIGKHSLPRPSNTGKNNYLWKGDKVSYRSLHHWVQRHLGKAIRCEECGNEEKCIDGRPYVGWANISHEYKRDLTDWKQLCYRCHKAFDGMARRMAKV